MYAFSRSVFIIAKFLKLVLNYYEKHQSGGKRFVNDRTSYLKDFNFQVNFTREIPITFMKLDKSSKKQNVLCNSNKNLEACNFMKTASVKKE